MRELRLEGWEGCGRQCIPAELERSVNEEPGGVVRRESSILSGKENSSRNQQCARFLGGSLFQILPVLLKVVRI